MYVIYGATNCASCSEAKEVLSHNGLPYEYLTRGVDYDMSDFVSISKGAHRSFPLITLNGEYLGGLVQLKEHLDNTK